MYRRLVFIFAVALSASSAVRADSIWIGNGPSALELKDVSVKNIAAGKLLFQSAGREATRDLATVSRISISDDPRFSNAEAAFVAGKFDQATDGYQATLQTTNKPWLKLRIASRLSESAQKVNRFDAAVNGYLAAVLNSDQPATIARPAIPAARSSYLTTAVTQVNAALADPKVTEPQKQALSAFLIDLQRAGGDQQGAAVTAEHMLQAGAAKGDASASAAIAKVKLDAAAAMLNKRDYAAAADELNKGRALFVDPKDQVAALYDLALAQNGLAMPRSDPAPWKDVALAYMRVVAHFPDHPLAAKSLLATAQIEQHQLSDPAAAKLLYQQIVTQFPNDPAAKSAQEQLQQLPTR